MSHRIENRQNVYINGQEATVFKVYERRGDAYIHAGKSWALGHDASERDCLDAWQAHFYEGWPFGEACNGNR